MSVDKLSSDEVPGKFAEWLLAMGCPAEKVPSIDKVAEMCRGQYYMVWRSLMEHVEAKDVVRSKRMQVFCDDIRRCQKKSFNKLDTNAVVPEQLTLWNQQEALKQKVDDAKSRVTLVRQDLNELMDKNSCKLSQRNLSRCRAEEIQRRAWFLQQIAEDLRSKKSNLHETKAIAESLCSVDDEADLQSKLEKYLTSLRRHNAQAAPASHNSQQLSNPIASSSVISAYGENADFEDHLTSVVKCRGDALCSELYARRTHIVKALAAGDSTKSDLNLNRLTPQSVLAHTAALHCSLALEATKNKVHIKQAHKRLIAAVAELNNYLTGEACELLVLRCEKAHMEARVTTLRLLLDEVTNRAGIFESHGEIEHRTALRPIRDVDKAIESKREELKRVIASLSATERKIQNVKECLVTVFSGFDKDSPSEMERYRGGPQLNLPQESIPTLREFYESRRDTRKQKIDLSMELEVSDYSFNDAIDVNNPRFIDELRIYLKKFNLEKNRKLVLESGEKVWIFETLQASVKRLHTQWQSKDTVCSLICPSDCLANNLHRVIQDVLHRHVLEDMVKRLCEVTAERDRNLNMTEQINGEDQIMDKIKKRLKENLQNLQKTDKTLVLGQTNLKLWSENNIKRHISNNRTVNGMLYKEYEVSWLDNCMNV